MFQVKQAATVSKGATDDQNPPGGGSPPPRVEKMTDEELLSTWDPGKPNVSVATLSQRTGASPEQVQKALTRAALAAAEGLATPWWKREAISIAVGCLILIPLMLAAFHKKAALSTVVAKRNLVPYQTLTASSDVEISASIVAVGGLTSTSQIEGHYLRTQVSAGQPILKSDLSGTSAPDLQGRSIVEIPSKTGAAQPSPTPRCVSVLFTSKSSGKDGSTAMGVWWLGVRQGRDMDWVVLAVPTAELEKINAALSGSDPILAAPATLSAECNFHLLARVAGTRRPRSPCPNKGVGHDPEKGK